MEKKAYSTPEAEVFICMIERCVLSEQLNDNQNHPWVEPANPKDGQW